MIQQRITSGLGALTPATWNRVMAAVVEYEKTKYIPQPKQYISDTQPRSIFAQIVESSLLSAGRWKYSWTRVALTGGTSACTLSSDTDYFTAMSASLSNVAQSASPTWAINSAELGNTTTLQNGYTVNGSTNKIIDAGGTQTLYEIKPIKPYTVVVLGFASHVGGTNRLQPYFTYANTVDGNCGSAFQGGGDPNEVFEV